MIHPSIPYDPALVEEVAARMDLRVPNREALDAIARRFDEADGAAFEAVCDLATAVGKTYIAGAIVDYLSTSGIRNFLIVVPNRTVLRKTVRNFTEGDIKSVTGMDVTPIVITSEDYARGQVAASLSDDTRTKLFVFTVQALTRPTDKGPRRLRRPDENIGPALYQHLVDIPDLVVIADEHHSYMGPKFSQAISALDPCALIGLTATPSPKTPPEDIIYRYPLGRAIAEELVKTPVLVGRADAKVDVETQVADGLVLLQAKAAAVDAWSAATGAERINPVMFVIASSIEDANEIGTILRRPNFFGDDYESAVLVVHSEAEEFLTRLEAVESPDSKVRVIVNVAMLGVGWDVKNIYVICALRKLASKVLSEQTLGRGLRLPYGKHTGIQMLDTLEVLAHDRYQTLLERAGALLPVLIEERAGDVDGPGTHEGASTQGPEVVSGAAPVTPGTPEAEDRSVSALPIDENDPTAPVVVLPVAETRARIDANRAEAGAMTTVLYPKDGVPTLTVPQVRRKLIARDFKLADIDPSEFRELGERLAGTPQDTLRRVRLAAYRDPATGALELRPEQAEDVVVASQESLPLGTVRDRLIAHLMQTGIVEQRRPELAAAERLVDELIAGAGAEADARLTSFFATAAQTAAAIIRTSFKAAPVSYEKKIEVVTYAPVRPSRPVEPSNLGKFKVRAGYDGWTKSLLPVEWFDSKPERDLALVLEAALEVDLWVRVQRGELIIDWDGGSHSPDFLVLLEDGTYWFLEAKAQNKLDDTAVVSKRKAAEAWARYVSDEGFGTWRYGVVGEKAIAEARGSWSVLLAQAGVSP